MAALGAGGQVVMPPAGFAGTAHDPLLKAGGVGVQVFVGNMPWRFSSYTAVG
jgi:hypothetical protein